MSNGHFKIVGCGLFFLSIQQVTGKNCQHLITIPLAFTYIPYQVKITFFQPQFHAALLFFEHTFTILMKIAHFVHYDKTILLNLQNNNNFFLCISALTSICLLYHQPYHSENSLYIQRKNEKISCYRTFDYYCYLRTVMCFSKVDNFQKHTLRLWSFCSRSISNFPFE